MQFMDAAGTTGNARRRAITQLLAQRLKPIVATIRVRRWTETGQNRRATTSAIAKGFATIYRRIKRSLDYRLIFHRSISTSRCQGSPAHSSLHDLQPQSPTAHAASSRRCGSIFCINFC
jgi:hypothetical protein